MVTIELGIGSRSAGLGLAAYLIMFSTMPGPTPATAEDSAKATVDTNALVEVMTEAGAPRQLSKGYFANSPGCVSAKLDIWFARGHHSHQLFTMHAEEASMPAQSPAGTAPQPRQAGRDDKTDPAFYDVMDADGTTIFVGGDGCRFRVRIDKAE